MKDFKKFQSVTGGANRGPGGSTSNSSNPYAAKPAGKNRPNNNRNRPNNRNRGGGGITEPPVPAPVAPTPQGSATPIQDANKPGVISNLATTKPLDFFSGQMAGLGQMNAGGPSVYQNYLQNQFFNDTYSKFMNEKVNSPYDTSFDTYLTDTYGPGNAGLTAAAQRAFNLATPTQRGDFNNVFNNATGRTQFWG